MPRKVADVLSVRCEIKNYKQIKNKIDDMQKAPRKVLNSLTVEAKKRVPGWVATEVAKEYGVKKGEITGQKIGKVTPVGDSFKEVRIVYTGRLLTPTHFSMSPKAPNPGGYLLPGWSGAGPVWRRALHFGNATTAFTGKAVQTAHRDRTPFHSEVYFFNLVNQMAIKWGTPEKVNLLEPQTGAPISLGARGVLNFRIANARKLLLKLVGTGGKLTRQDLLEDGEGHIKNYFRSLIQLNVSTNLANIITSEKLDSAILVFGGAGKCGDIDSCTCYAAIILQNFP